MSKESESYRRQMLRRLQQKDSDPPPPEVLEAEKVIAKHREEQARAREAIPRARLPLPEPDICPDCWVYHGTKVRLSGAPHPDPGVSDRFECPICDYFEDRSSRPDP
jgi:hypothetical protein